MAITPIPTIPPEFVERQQEIVSYVKQAGTVGRAVRISGKLSNKRTLDKRPVIKKAAERCARWLAARHIPGASRTQLNNFIYERTNEIKSGVFLPPYFGAMTLLLDRTAYGDIQCSALNVPTPPEYFDPARLQQNCRAKNIDQEYDTPTAGSVPPLPSAGWAGKVENGVWSDTHHAMLRVEYQRPSWSMSQPERQVFFTGNVTFNVTASHRPARFWYSLFASARQFTSPSGFLPFSYDLPGTSPPAGLYRGTMKAPSTPFTETMIRPFVVDAMTTDKSKFFFGEPRIEGFISSPKASGQFFAKNDYVTVSLEVEHNMYQALAPGE